MIKHLILGIILFSAVSCTENQIVGDNSSSQPKEQANPLDGYSPVKIELATDVLELMIPGNNSLDKEAEIFTSNSGVTNVIIGKNFHMEIVEFDQDIETIKSDLNNDIFYKSTVVEENEDRMIYEKELPDHSKKFVHFFMKKEINGQLIAIRSGSNGEFKRSHIDRMIKSANTIKLIEELASSVN